MSTLKFYYSVMEFHPWETSVQFDTKWFPKFRDSHMSEIFRGYWATKKFPNERPPLMSVWVLLANIVMFQIDWFYSHIQ